MSAFDNNKKLPENFVPKMSAINQLLMGLADCRIARSEHRV
jgi:hypothetical protein